MKGYIIIVFALYIKMLDGSRACDNISCPPSSTCTPRTSSPGYKCACYSGYVPPHCEDRDECSSSKFNSSLCNNGACVNTPGSYFCKCNSGYTGKRCDQHVDPCLSNPCQNGGTCQSSADGTFKCVCYAGFSSSNNCKDLNECMMVPGLCHNGTCQNTLGSFKCSCNAGYQGQRCTRDFNECYNHPCNNNSACVNTVGSYKCMCYPGYTGPSCTDRNECSLSSNICNHGACVNTPGSFKCVCQTGYNGHRCNQDIDECSNSPCVHGLCVNTQGSYRCHCNSGYQGQLCQEQIVTILTSPLTTPKQTEQTSSSPSSPISTTSTSASKSDVTPTNVQIYTISKSSESFTLSSTVSTTSALSSSSSKIVPSASPVRPSKTGTKSSLYTALSKITHAHFGQKTDRTTLKQNYDSVTDRFKSIQTSKDNVQWTQDHWYVFILIGFGLAAGILVSIVVLRRRQRKATVHNLLNGTINVTSTAIKDPVQQENPLYFEFHGHDSSTSDL